MDWYPWYFTIYEQDTMHLNPYQDGCYRRLIDHYMKTRAPLPDNDAALARIIGDSEANWVAMASPIVRPFFRPEKGLLFHSFCDRILGDQDNRTNKLSLSGKKGAEKRWSKIKYIDSHPIATPLGVLRPIDSTGQDKTVITDSNLSTDSNLYPSIANDENFETFWRAYPKQRAGAKDKARTAWKNATKKVNPGILIQACERYAKSDEVVRGYAKGCAAWLNDERWTTDYTAKPKTKSGTEPNRSNQGPDQETINIFMGA